MKKYFLLILIGILFFSPSISKAISGACSSHNGVNCGLGASSTGRVQCNDSWINSSVYFSDAEECKIKCIYPVQTFCSLSDVEQQRQSALGSAAAVGGPQRFDRF